MGRFDFFRILLPGAIVTALLDIVARIVSRTPGPEWPEAAALINFIESPLRALVAAFAVGLVLYLLDPAYSAAEYWLNIPSEHLRKRLRERGHEDADHISLYFLASDESMPAPLQDRALLYGALFRTGYQLTVYVLLAGAITPWLIHFNPNVGNSAESNSELWGLASGITVLLAAAGVLAAKLSRTRGAERSSFGSWASSTIGITARQLDSQSDAWIIPAVSAAVTGGVLAAGSGESLHEWRAIPVGLVLLAWLTIRILGPVAPRVEGLRTGSSKKPSDPFRSTCRLVLDLAPVVVGVGGLVAAADMAAPEQSAAIGCLLVLGYALSYARKVERQQQGIYRNQNLWMDLHLDELVEQADQLRET